MKIRNTLLLISFLLSQLVVLAQNDTTVTGVIFDDTEQPLPEASIVVKGTTTGAQTDFNENYSLDRVPVDGVLSISYLFIDYNYRLTRHQY